MAECISASKRVARAARARRQRRDGPGSGARAEAILAGSIASIALVARKTSGGSARVRPAPGDSDARRNDGRRP